MKKKKKKPLFVDLSRKRRRSRVLGWKSTIARSAPLLKGIFYSQDYIKNNDWVDIVFLSKKDNSIYYNVALSTTKYQYKELCFEKACDLADELVPNDFSIVNHKYQVKVNHQEPHWDGLKWIDFIKREEERLANEQSSKVKSYVKIDRDYRAGVGLHAVLPHDSLTVDNICEFIEKFWADGEPDSWEGEEEYSYNSEVIDWGCSANALVEPWEQMVFEATSEKSS